MRLQDITKIQVDKHTTELVSRAKVAPKSINVMSFPGPSYLVLLIPDSAPKFQLGFIPRLHYHAYRRSGGHS